MADFSLTTLFVVPVGNTLPSSGSTQNLAAGQVVSAATNVPLDRGIRKLQNLKDASDAENEEWMRVANALGWAKWELEWQKDKKKNYLRKERHSMSYYQTIPLSEKIIPGKVKAKLTDGVLDIILPKSNPTPIPKKKSVNVQ